MKIGDLVKVQRDESRWPLGARGPAGEGSADP
jgi:hypothetical protein